ncbi:hypothetical protein [Moraxella nonliquefaciens]|uniref:Transposase n=1 Tax=Moraxella nonliquefaciens TaxID=478 RepID=A0A7T3BYB8_MORNO|nr:hypothetical protein [Moraxella nonliquefaciens]QPT44146.1 hypothetical protein I6G26_08755 [Moraxella nonliquefaciens]QQC29165.1 hypothetical protein I6H63_07540 [Moraxella nonliquefaciens]
MTNDLSFKTANTEVLLFFICLFYSSGRFIHQADLFIRQIYSSGRFIHQADLFIRQIYS